MNIRRDFYPLDMFAERVGISISDLLHLGGRDEAQICVNVYGLATSMKMTAMDTSAEPGSLEESAEFQALDEAGKAEARAYERRHEDWLSRTARAMPSGIFELSPEDLRLLEMPDELPFELSEARRFDGTRWFNVEFPDSITIDLRYLCILHAEAVRLAPSRFGGGGEVQQIPGPARWPWGNHTTDLLDKMAEAAHALWRLYDPADPSTAPTNEQVVAFLRERGVAQRTAESMATILRADGLPTGPRK